MAKPKNTKPNAAEFTALKDWLKAQGFKQPDLDAALGTTVNNRPRAQIATQLVAHLKKSRKKVASQKVASQKLASQKKA